VINLALFFLVLAPVVAIVYVVWAYRKKTAARAAASSERLARLLNAPAAGAAPSDVTAQDVSRGEPSVAAPAARGAVSYARRPSFLSRSQIELHDRLRIGLPGHHVFAHVPLVAMIDLTGMPEGREREQRLRALAQHMVDCVVCSGTFEIVAAIDLEHGNTAEARFKAECLKGAGIPYLRWNPAQLPRGDEVAALIKA
jgi:hypothetical protein